MTIRDLLYAGIEIQGQVRIQEICASEDYPVPVWEGEFFSGDIPDEILDRGIAYIYPYITNLERVSVACLCIEIIEEE